MTTGTIVDHQMEGYTREIMIETGGKGPDIILEMLSNVNLNKDLQMIAHGGKICVIGCRGTIEINPRLLMAKESHIYGIGLANASKPEVKEMKAAIEAGLQYGWVTPSVSSVQTLTNAKGAHITLMTDASLIGRIIMSV